MKQYIVLLAIASILGAMPNTDGTTGLIRSISADNGSAGTFGFGFYSRGFYEERIADPTGDSIGDGLAGVNSKYGGGDLGFNLGYAVTDWFAFNVSSEYYLDGIDYETTGFNRASVGFGDTRVGLKFGLGGEHLMYGLYGLFSIPTGADRNLDTLGEAKYPIFNEAYTNPGGLFRYFSSDNFDYGAIGLLTLRYGIMDIDLNLGMLMRNGENGGVRDNASIYNAAISLNTGGVVPFVEMSGIDFGGKDQFFTFTDDSVYGPNQVYITPGLCFKPNNHFNINLAVDLRAWEGENERPFGTPGTVGDSFNITTGWGAAPPWAIFFGFSYVNDFMPEKPKRGDIAGSVMDSETKEPISTNVGMYQVGTLIASKVSMADGSFTFPKLEPATYTLMVKHANYKPYSVDLLVKPGETTPITVALVRIPEEPKEGVLILNIIDIESKQTMAAMVTIGTMEPEKTMGRLEKTLKPGVYTVKVMAEAPDYLPYERNVTIEAGKTLDLEVALVKKEFKIVLPQVYFETAKSEIKPESYPVLDGAAETIKKVLGGNPTVKIEVQGHTDSRGSDDYNLRLSNDRAGSVKNYLVINHGIDETRLLARGYGESRPVASNDNPEGMAKNRRVEFVILK